MPRPNPRPSGGGTGGGGQNGNGNVNGNGGNGNGGNGGNGGGGGSTTGGSGVTGTSGNDSTPTTETAPAISHELQRLIVASQANFPDAWAKATGTTNVQTQYERVTGTTIPNIFLEDVETIAEEQAEEKRILAQQEAEQEAVRIETERIERERLAAIDAERVRQIEQAPIYQRLSDQVTQIINDINNNIIQVPDWFRNNIEWVQNGHITEQEFLTAYNYLVQEQIVHTPTEQEVITQPTVNDSISNNMITQKLNNFTIIDGRAKGSITFTATNSFNPYYYNKNIINLIQFKTVDGASILPSVKTNNLRFTVTERTETIHYDEDMSGNTNVSVESFVWEWIDKPLGAFSTVLRFNIDTSGKIQSEGFMGAGIAVSAIAFSIALGYIIDQRGKKK